MLNHNYTNVSVPARECWYCLWRLWDRNLFKYICKWAHKILFNKYSDICSYTILEQSWTLESTLWIKSCCNVVFSGTKKMAYFVHIWTGEKNCLIVKFCFYKTLNEVMHVWFLPHKKHGHNEWFVRQLNVSSEPALASDVLGRGLPGSP